MSYQPRHIPGLLIAGAKIFLVALLLGCAVLACLVYYFSHDLPDYSQLKEYHPPCVTRIYSSDGKLMEEYAKEKRIFVPVSSVPKSLIQAFIAAEDKNFYEHSGIDIFSIMRAAIANIAHVADGSRIEGGSTITQQVVKNFLLTSERSFERKIKEAILSYMISQILSKEQILELYLNQIFLGKGTYGVAAAALAYFNKSVEELSISESALLASLPKSPSTFNPERNYERVLIRRNYVIGRMLDDGYITADEAEKAIAEPIKLVKQDKVQTMDADYYAGQVRSEVIGMFGREYFYTAGLTIISCADSRLQKSAADALRSGIKVYDMKRGYRGPVKNISLTNWQSGLAAIPKPVGLRHYKLAIVLEAENTRAKVGLLDGKAVFIKLSDMGWTKTGLKSVKEILKKGDVIVIEKVQNEYRLQQIPEVNGGIMVVEPNTGRILAAEGGYDYDISKFDRTTQANRQPGSLIKPFVYLAALEKGMKPNDIFEDSPIEVARGAGMPVWRPKNFEGTFLGPMTLRKGLEKSRNTITVRVGQATGTGRVAETFKRFGINDNPARVPSIVLGALETTLERMTIAYSIIANKGREVIPHYIELIKDRKGNVLYRRDYADCTECRDYRRDAAGSPLPPAIPVSPGKEITDEATSYQITSILIGAIQRGTGQAAKPIPKIIAGKTGTSNDAKDAWFIGFTPRMVIGTYIGYDTPRSLGKRASGATIALPVFIEFMKTGYKDVESVDFEPPPSIELKAINYDTGNFSTGKDSILEAFKIAGYRPKSFDPEKEEQEELDPFSKIQMEDLLRDQDLSDETD